MQENERAGEGAGEGARGTISRFKGPTSVATQSHPALEADALELEADRVRLVAAGRLRVAVQCQQERQECRVKQAKACDQ